MKRIALALFAATFALAGCQGTSDSLSNGQGAGDSTSTAGGDQQHANDPNAADPTSSYAPPDPGQTASNSAAQGSPVVAARLHSCGKVAVASLGTMLQNRGVNITATGTGTAGNLYKNGAAALGAANYAGRVPEASFASTSSMAKMMDIFASASSEIDAKTWAPTSCTGVALFDSSNNFTQDGISCIIGRPATAEHVTVANQVVAAEATPAQGQMIAISAMMAAVYTCN